MTLQFPAIMTPSEVGWISPAPGLWVASRGDRRAGSEYAGMVERVDGRFHARSARGRTLGSFEDLDAARAAVTLSLSRQE